METTKCQSTDRWIAGLSARVAELMDHLEMAEVQETLKRLQCQKGIQGIIVVNTEGIPIKSTMDNPTTTQYANPHAQLHIEGPEHPA